MTKTYYDTQGRVEETVDAGDHVHYIVYENNQTIRFPNWDSTNTKSLMPVQVTVVDDGGTVTETFSIDGDATSITHPSDVPTGIGTPSRSDYVSWTRHFYDDVNGRRVKSLRYDAVPSSGDGSELTNYYVTAYDYDDLGRVETTIQSSTSGRQQVTQRVYDTLNRVTEIKKGAGSTGLDTDADNDLGTLSLPTLQTVSTTEFDAGDVGDSHVTTTRRYYDTGSTDYVKTEYKRTWRGHVRGTVRSNGTTAFSPYTVVDMDWQGRATAQARYTSQPTWTTVLTGDNYTDYIAGHSTGRNDWSKTYYDDLGRVYRTEAFPGTESTNHQQVNNYYDRNGRLVCTGQKYNVHTEYAYDGAGRRYQTRTVSDVESTPYSSGAFVYRAPEPNSSVSSMSGSDDGLIAFTHLDYDDAGNVTGRTCSKSTIPTPTVSASAPAPVTCGRPVTAGTTTPIGYRLQQTMGPDRAARRRPPGRTFPSRLGPARRWTGPIPRFTMGMCG